MSRALQNEILVCASLHGLGTLFFLSAVSFSTRRSQSVKLGYVCSLCHARSESLGNRTLFSLPFFPPLSLPFPSLPFFSFSLLFYIFSFFYSFPSTRFPLYLSRQPLAIRSPQGKLVFSIARRRAGTKTRGIQAAKSKQPFFPNRNLDYTRGGCKCAV